MLILDPMYGEYAHIFENVLTAKIHRHNLPQTKKFAIEHDALLSAIRMHGPDMVVLVNPNSPTGSYWDSEKLFRLVRSVPSRTLVVVDEAYIEYVGSKHSLEKHIEKQKNLVIIKSMSKVYALSGVRVGYVAAHHSIIEKIAPLIPPWSVSMAGQIAAVEALKDPAYYQLTLRDMA